MNFLIRSLRASARLLCIASAAAVSVGVLAPPAAAAPGDEPTCLRGPNPNVYYKITNVGTGKSLNVARKSRASGAPIIQWAYAGGTNEQWRAVCAANWQYKLVARHSGLVLDLAASSTVQRPYTGVPSQKWGLSRVGQEGALATFNLYNQGTSTVIEAAADGSAVESAVAEEGDRQQLWTFEETGAV
ncbi:RICIN domain-containing protein [Actinoplanes sp. NPDC023801]|uniref:RICIN domain-containing protein n=1 Tax=Actinoplanes sp. NPDC023801 TaxID=3154595 RepID=UPI0033E4A9B1